MTRLQIKLLEEYQSMMNVLDNKVDELERWQEVALAEKRQEILRILSGDRRERRGV